MLIDSHLHLQLMPYTEMGITQQQVVAQAKAAGITQMLCVATHIDQTADLYKIAAEYRQDPKIDISIGIHPNEAIAVEPEVETLLDLQDNPDVIAIGETGLDFLRGKQDLDLQKRRFANHIEASIVCNKPLIVHTRAAKQETIDMLKCYTGSISGVMHCFCEDYAAAKQFLDMGLYISFSGIVTFKNAQELQQCASKLPLDRILIETDSPYLAPVPMRGKTNQPAYVQYVAEYLAGLHKISVTKLIQQVYQNYQDLFIVKA